MPPPPGSATGQGRGEQAASTPSELQRSLAEASSFTFVGWEAEGAVVRLRYRIGADLDLTEEVELPAPVPEIPEASAALDVLHLCAGVSYYKCVAPRELRFDRSLAPAEEALVRALYDEGLREHAYQNDLAIPLPVEIVAAPGPDLEGPRPNDRGRTKGAQALIPIGGGKDSALVADVVPDGSLMAVNPTGAHEHLAEHLGRPLLRVRRSLDPLLRELVEAGAPNGHVPVTAINSAIAVVVALAEGLADVLMGLEWSASEPTVVVDGNEVNHQYSKSLEAEGLLADAFAPTGVTYLSLLRPFGELAIGSLVGLRGLAPEVMSCNRAFAMWRENPQVRSQRPCGTCPKCLFSALMLAPSVGPSQMATMYEESPFDDLDLLDDFRQLWADEGKPFECVGERLESVAAMAWLGRLPEWADAVVVKALAPEAADRMEREGVEVADLLVAHPVAVPGRYQATIDVLTSQLAGVTARVGAGRAPG